MKVLDHGYVNLVESYGSDERIIEPTLKGANDGADRKRVFARGSEYVRKYLDQEGVGRRIASRMASAARSAKTFAQRVAGKVKEVGRAA